MALTREASHTRLKLLAVQKGFCLACKPFRGNWVVVSCLQGEGVDETHGMRLQRMGLRGHGEGGRLGLGGRTAGIAHDRGEFREKRPEAVEGGAVLGVPTGDHGSGRFGPLGRGYRVAGGPGSLILVGKEEFPPGLPEMPLDMVGEQAQEEVGPDPIRQPVVEGTDLEVDRLHRPERPLDPGEGLVVAHTAWAIEALRPDRGADDIDPIEGRLGGDGLLLTGKGQARVGDREREVFGHLVAVHDTAHGQADPVLPLEPSGRDPDGDLHQILFGGPEQVLALVAPQLHQLRVATGDEPLPRIVGMGELAEVPFIEEIGLEGLVFHKRADRGTLQGRDPVQAPLRPEIRDCCPADHPAVTDHHEPPDPEGLLDPADLGKKRRGIRRIALVHREGHRTAPPIGHEPIVHLEGPPPAVTAVAPPGQGTGRPLKVAGGEVVEHQALSLEMPGGQLLLDAPLTGQKPVHGGITVLFTGRRDPEGLGERGGLPGAGHGHFGLGIKDAGGDQGEHEIPLPARFPGDQGGQPQALHHPVHRLDVPLGLRALDHEARPCRLQVGALENGTQKLDLVHRQMREIGERALFDRLPLAVGLPQQDGGACAPIGHEMDMHAYRISHNAMYYKQTNT